MVQGKVSAVLEVWGHSPLYAKYVAGSHQVVNAGLEGPSGNIGWYVPTYLMQQHPELEDVEGRAEGLEALRHAAVVAAGPVPRRLAELRHQRPGAREEAEHQPQGRLRRHRGCAADRDRVGLQGEEAGALLLVHAAVSERDLQVLAGAAPAVHPGVRKAGAGGDQLLLSALPALQGDGRRSSPSRRPTSPPSSSASTGRQTTRTRSPTTSRSRR